MCIKIENLYETPRIIEGLIFFVYIAKFWYYISLSVQCVTWTQLTESYQKDQVFYN